MQLSDYVACDLNQPAELPFSSRQFDLAICTVSVEHLINPIDLFKQVARALKSGSPFIATFSERWFPSKVIQM
jgi:SAM-dependent methyltransferase